MGELKFVLTPTVVFAGPGAVELAGGVHSTLVGGGEEGED